LSCFGSEPPSCLRQEGVFGPRTRDLSVPSWSLRPSTPRVDPSLGPRVQRVGRLCRATHGDSVPRRVGALHTGCQRVLADPALCALPWQSVKTLTRV